MKYRLTPEAELDLRGIWSYTRDTWGQQKANDYLRQIKTCLDVLCGHPEMGRLRNEIRTGYRSMVQAQHVVFYRINDEQLEVVRILHHRMDMKELFRSD